MVEMKQCWWMEGSWLKPSRRVVRVVMAPVEGQSNKAWGSSAVVAHGAAEFRRGGLEFDGIVYVFP